MFAGFKHPQYSPICDKRVLQQTHYFISIGLHFPLFLKSLTYHFYFLCGSCGFFTFILTNITFLNTESFLVLNQLKTLANIVLKYRLELFRLKFVERKSGSSKTKIKCWWAAFDSKSLGGQHNIRDTTPNYVLVILMPVCHITASDTVRNHWKGKIRQIFPGFGVLSKGINICYKMPQETGCRHWKTSGFLLSWKCKRENSVLNLLLCVTFPLWFLVSVVKFYKPWIWQHHTNLFWSGVS